MKTALLDVTQGLCWAEPRATSSSPLVFPPCRPWAKRARSRLLQQARLGVSAAYGRPPAERAVARSWGRRCLFHNTGPLQWLGLSSAFLFCSLCQNTSDLSSLIVLHARMHPWAVQTFPSFFRPVIRVKWCMSSSLKDVHSAAGSPRVFGKHLLFPRGVYFLCKTSLLTIPSSTFLLAKPTTWLQTVSCLTRPTSQPKCHPINLLVH